jgi:Na+/proline symporter
MWAVSITDFFQSIMIIIGLLALGWQMYQQAGGFMPVINAQPAGFFNFLPEGNWGSISLYVGAWITVGLGSIPQQDIFQRIMAAKSENTAVRASYIAAVMYLVIGFIPLFIGLWGKFLYPGMNDDEHQMLIPRMVLEHGSGMLQILFFGALLSAILSTTSGAMLAPATVIGENLIRPYFSNLTDKQLLRIMRLSVLGVALCSALMAGRESNIFKLAEQSSSLSLVALFVPLAAGLYWKKASDKGALASVSLGMLVWMICSYYDHTQPILPGLLASVAGMLLGSFLFPDKSYALFRAWREEAASAANE